MALSSSLRRTALAVVHAGSIALSAHAVSACDTANPGIAPVPAQLNFPTVVTVTPEVDGRSFLLVANANFDLRYNQGTLQSYDITAMREAIAGCSTPPCSFENLASFLVSEVQLGSHVSAMALSPRGDRVYLGVRSEADLTWVDFSPGTGALTCEGTGQPELCANRRRTTTVELGCDRTVTLRGDPVGLVVGSLDALGGPADRDYVVLVQRGGFASLFLDVERGNAVEPVLTQTIEGLAYYVVQAVPDPSGTSLWVQHSYPPSVANTNTTARITRDMVEIAVSYDASRPACSTVYVARRLPLRGIDDGADTRDLAFDATGRKAFLVTRRPEGLVEIDFDQAPLFPDEAPVFGVTPVGYGPSRVERIESNGHEFFAVSCFDGRSVWFVDPVDLSPRAIAAGLSGPYELGFDPTGQLVFVADFRDSVIRAIDVSAVEAGDARVVATFGTVRAVQVLR